MMDESHEHNGVYVKGDESEKDLLIEAHIRKGRTVVYSKGARNLVATGYYVVACCEEVGIYLTEMRKRQLANRVT